MANSEDLRALFDGFLRYKAKIEGSNEIIGMLRGYVSGEEELDWIGAGFQNVHYRLGRLESGLWLATREVGPAITKEGELQRIYSEDYLAKVLYSTVSGRPSLEVCLGVRVHRGGEWFDDNYFLIVEDLQRGGEADFIPARSGRSSGFVDGMEVWYDFEWDLPRSDEESDFRYLTNENMIHVHLDR